MYTSAVHGGKSMWTLGLYTCLTSFGSSTNLHHQMFPVIAHQTCTTVNVLQNCCSSVIFLWCLAWIALLRSCRNISITLRSGLWLGHSRKRIFCFDVAVLCFFSKHVWFLLTTQYFASSSVEPPSALLLIYYRLEGHIPHLSWFHHNWFAFCITNSFWFTCCFRRRIEKPAETLINWNGD